MARACFLALVLAACGGASPPKPAQLPRVATSGDAILALLPSGADAVLELDVARLRGNPTLGPLVSELAANPRGELGFAPLADVDLLVAAVYFFGRDDATTVFVLRGEHLPAEGTADRVAFGEALDEHTIVSAPDAWRGRIRTLAKGKSLAEDLRFRRDRDLAMPERASGAAVRLTVRLGKNARIRAAGRLGVDEVPSQISLWGDVADDFAVLALLGADDDKGAARAGEAVRALVRGLVAVAPPWSQAQKLLATLKIETRGPVAVVRWVVGARRLQRWVKDMRERVVESRP